LDLVGEILPALAALYVVDSAFLVRAGQVLFVSGWDGTMASLPAGLRFPGLLPSADAVLGVSLPLRVQADGVLLPVASGPPRLVRFDSMPRAAAEGGSVRLGPSARLAVRPASLAREVADVVERLRVTPRSRRLARWRRELRRRTDARALAALRARHERGLVALRALSWATFTSLFVVLPASLTPHLPVRPSPVAAVALALALWAAAVTVSARLLRGCGLRGRRLLSALLPLLLFPPGAAHAGSLVARELYLGFEPEALARAMLSPARLEAWRRERPRPDSGDRWSVATLVHELAARGGGDAAPVTPARQDPSAVAYCPTCRGEFRAGFTRCSQCEEVLRPFA
jgi:hypothetical protein